MRPELGCQPFANLLAQSAQSADSSSSAFILHPFCGRLSRTPRRPTMNRSAATLPSALDAIGDTPLVELSRLTGGLAGRILAKLEYLNPGFSKKDRIARQMIEEAESAGELTPGQTIVELTSSGLKYLSTDLWL